MQLLLLWETPPFKHSTIFSIDMPSIHNKQFYQLSEIQEISIVSRNDTNKFQQFFGSL